MTPQEHRENVRQIKRRNMIDRIKKDNKNYDPFPKGARYSIKEDASPIMANPFMEFNNA